MPEYIDLAAARAFVEANYQGDPLLRHLYGTLLDKLPTVDAVEVVHGYWRYYSTTMQECSYCKRHTARHKYKYCPHCRAVMEDKYNDG
jgi:hypothetical protein